MHMPAESRNAVAVGVIVIGLVVAGLAAFGDPRSWREPPSIVSNDKLGGIDPVEPVDPENPGPSLTEDDPESLEDPTNPFVTSIGGNFEHKVTIRVSADGVVQVGVYYRDGKQQEQVGVDSNFSTTRTFTGGYPLSMVMVTIPKKYPGRATRATCTISIDGRKVDKDTTTKPRSLARCVA